ncbi:MAG: hypothetical protein ACO1N0_06155 [Fluviicola sp.]
MKHFVILLSLASVLLNSCSQKTNNPIILTEKVDVHGYIDLNQYSVSSDVFYFQNEVNSEIYLYNPIDSTIYSINLKEINLKKICSFPVGSVQGLAYNNDRNSFIAFANDSIYEFSENGKLVKTICCGKVFNGFPCVVNSSGFNIKSSKDEVYIHYFADDSLTYKSPDFFKNPIEIALNLESNKFRLLSSGYPHSYKTNCFGLQFAPERITKDQKQRIYTFAYNDSAFVYENDKLTSFFFGTRRNYVKSSLNFQKIKSYNSSIFQSFLNDVSSYYFITYLPYSKKFIRKFNSKSKTNSELQISTIIYDENFNYIGETNFKNFNGGLIFDTKELGVIQLLSDKNKLGIYKTQWNEAKN